MIIELCYYISMSDYMTSNIYLLIMNQLFTFVYSYPKMLNLAKLEFVALEISGDNYLSWVSDAEIRLDVLNLGDTCHAKFP